MAKRSVREKETVIDPEESDFKVGTVCSYYDEGWRVGVVEALEVDDDGDLLVTVRPVSKGRRVKEKSKDLKL